jgi:hypothetical protein
MNKKPVVLLSCAIFEPIFKENDYEAGFDEVSYLEIGLHNTPKKLKSTVQERIDQISEPSLIVLGYGLCGNGLDGIQSGIHTLLISWADDCIMMLMGSRERYFEEHKKDPGTYFISKGWLEADLNPVEEYKEVLDKYGEKTALMVMDMQYRNYNRLIFIAHNKRDFSDCQTKLQPVVSFFSRWNLEYQEYLGSLDFIQRLLDKAVNSPTETGNDFIVVPPGRELTQKDFIRYE